MKLKEKLRRYAPTKGSDDEDDDDNQEDDNDCGDQHLLLCGNKRKEACLFQRREKFHQHWDAMLEEEKSFGRASVHPAVLQPSQMAFIIRLQYIVLEHWLYSEVQRFSHKFYQFYKWNWKKRRMPQELPHLMKQVDSFAVRCTSSVRPSMET